MRKLNPETIVNFLITVICAVVSVIGGAIFRLGKRSGRNKVLDDINNAGERGITYEATDGYKMQVTSHEVKPEE